jgi:hypothetical protein
LNKYITSIFRVETNPRNKPTETGGKLPFFLDLLLYPENGGDIFLRNIEFSLKILLFIVTAVRISFSKTCLPTIYSKFRILDPYQVTNYRYQIAMLCYKLQNAMTKLLSFLRSMYEISGFYTGLYSNGRVVVPNYMKIGQKVKGKAIPVTGR